jgi:hypothetical protein
MGSKFRCIRSTPTEMQSMSENDFQCFDGRKHAEDNVSEFRIPWFSTSSKPRFGRRRWESA